MERLLLFRPDTRPVCAPRSFSSPPRCGGQCEVSHGSWRSDGAITGSLRWPLSLPSTLPGCPKNRTRACAPQLCTPILVAHLVVVTAGGFQELAARARTAHHHATLHSRTTFQQHAEATAPPSGPAAAPACCQLKPCASPPWHTLLRNSARSDGTSAHMQANFPAQSRGLRGLKTRDIVPQPTHPEPSMPRNAKHARNARNASKSLSTLLSMLLYQLHQSHNPFPKLPSSLPSPTQPLPRPDRDGARHRAPPGEEVELKITPIQAAAPPHRHRDGGSTCQPLLATRLAFVIQVAEPIGSYATLDWDNKRSRPSTTSATASATATSNTTSASSVSPDVTEMSWPSHIHICHTLSQAVARNNCHTSHAVCPCHRVSIHLSTCRQVDIYRCAGGFAMAETSDALTRVSMMYRIRMKSLSTTARWDHRNWS